MRFRRNLPRLVAVLIFMLLSGPIQRIALCSVELAAASESDDDCCGTHVGASCPMKKKGSDPSTGADESGPRMNCCTYIAFAWMLEESAATESAGFEPPHFASVGMAAMSPILPDDPSLPIYLPPRHRA